MVHEVSYTCGQYFGFAAARTSYDHQWAIHMLHCYALLFIQTL